MPVDMYIDPGLEGTGWATFVNNSYEDSGVIHSGLQWQQKVNIITNCVKNIAHTHDVLDITCEWPGLWSGSAVSQASAAKGDLFKLAYLIGSIAKMWDDRNGRPLRLISPQEWKGQLPKEVVMRRVHVLLPNVKLSNHMADAIGMGLAAQGLLGAK